MLLHQDKVFSTVICLKGDNEMSHRIHRLHYCSVWKICHLPCKCKVIFLRSGVVVRCHLLLETDVRPTKTPLVADLKGNAFDSGVVVKSPSARCASMIREGGGGLGAERGRNDHGSRRGDVAQWAAVAVRYKAYDRCFS